MPTDTPNQPAAPRRLSALKGLWPFLRPYKARIALAFVLLCLGSATILVVPLAFRDLIDFGFGDRAQAGNSLLGEAWQRLADQQRECAIEQGGARIVHQLIADSDDLAGHAGSAQGGQRPGYAAAGDIEADQVRMLKERLPPHPFRDHAARLGIRFAGVIRARAIGPQRPYTQALADADTPSSPARNARMPINAPYRRRWATEPP